MERALFYYVLADFGMLPSWLNPQRRFSVRCAIAGRSDRYEGLRCEIHKYVPLGGIHGH